jgi:nitrogen fixation protein FixH
MSSAAPTPWFARLLWPGLVFVLLGGQVVLVFVMVYIAVSDGSFAVEPDYYQKGLHWEATAEQLRTNARLGWKARLQVEDAATVLGERALICRLTDAAQQPLAGAAIDVVAFSHFRGNERTSLVLEEVGEGRYRTTLCFPRSGVWEFRLVVRRGPDVFTHTETREVAPPGN